jgi:leader peptidase (prepilin peptidase)/N-methyltransferase
VLTILILGCGLFGLAAGSFLNVVIYRVPRNESIVSPRSHCPHCSAPIREYDNIPVISWLVLRGRCRNCHAAISPRYLIVEVATGTLFAGVAARMGFVWQLLAYLTLVATLLALSCIDIELLVLPKKVIYPSLVLVSGFLVLASAADNEWGRLLFGVICAGAWFLLFFLMNFASPRILGFGDVRLAPLLGVALGWLGWRYALLGFFAANVFGAAIGVSLIATKRMARDQPIPYGVFLAAGAAFAIFAGPEILSHFQTIHVR